MPVKIACVWVSEAVDLGVRCFLKLKAVVKVDLHCITWVHHKSRTWDASSQDPRCHLYPMRTLVFEV